jgi:hypothetical protein
VAELRLYPLALELVAAGKSRITASGTVHNEVVALPTAQLIVPPPHVERLTEPNELEPGD